MAKGSQQGADFLLGTDPALVAEEWADSVRELAAEIQSNFWIVPPRRTGISNQVRAAFLIVALSALRQHAEQVRAHLMEKGDLRKAIGLFDKQLPNLGDMRDILDHLDEYNVGRGKLQRKQGATSNDGGPIAPVLALSGPGPDRRVDDYPADFTVVMISSLGVWEVRLDIATQCAELLFREVHRVHHDCRRCYRPGYRCTICRPLTDAEIAVAFSEADSAIPIPERTGCPSNASVPTESKRDGSDES